MILKTSKIRSLVNYYLRGACTYYEATDYIQLNSLQKNLFLNLDIFYNLLQEVKNENQA